MQSELLRKAREYEQEMRPQVRDTLPVYHATGGIGWINDPNGFSLYRGEVHLFFQYYPYATMWGPMHWGHAKTKDFVRWELLPAAMAPDADCDREGCFSGSAVELSDGRQLLLYTGVRKYPREDGGVNETQLQCVAVGDGIDYEKSPLNPVIDGSLLPEGGSTRDFRDPKIWRDDDGYHAVVANLCPDGGGAVLLYDSEDALRWHYAGVLAAGHGRYGTMWECPDFFPLDGKAVLIHSAHEMRAEGLEFHPGDGTVCHVGTLDGRQLVDEWVQAVDYGLDFYAPQTMETTDGRRVLIGWMQSWASSHVHSEGLPFFGQMTIPRELRILNGRLCQWPVRELERYRANKISYQNVPIRERQSLPGVSGRVLDLTLRVRAAGEAPLRRFSLRLAEGDGLYTELLLLPEEGILRMDRTYSGHTQDVVHVREIPVSFQNGALELRILLDKYSLELFANGGAQAASMTLYTPLTADGISFAADGTAALDVEKYDIVLA